ncbi:MAG TPA: glycine zipper 2TM domain-containing protein [Gammaproteobacteria bacterium]|nr:glycine zipper 2TM domain-containing protein [Gammaproteobacteria bacterium]
MRRMGFVLGITVLSLAASPAWATKKYYEREEYYDYGRVIDVDPIYETTYISTPRRECYDESVTHYREGSDSYTGMIAGGIIGGVAGNQVGKGRGNDVATVAGALLGGSIGRDLTRGGSRAYTEVERRCEEIDHHYKERHVSGYQVTYRYQGRIHTTHTDYHPGKKIRIKTLAHRHYHHDDDD